MLSRRPQSPLQRSFSDNPYLQSGPPIKDLLLVPLSDIVARNASVCSLYSLGSNASGPWVDRNENTPPLTSRSLIGLLPVNNNVQDHRRRACGRLAGRCGPFREPQLLPIYTSERAEKYIMCLNFPPSATAQTESNRG